MDRPGRPTMGRSSGRRRSRAVHPLVGAVAGVGLVVLALPIVALATRVPWSDAGGVLSRPATQEALRLSLLTSLAAAALAVLLGLPLAWLLARSTVPGQRALRAVATLPLVLPPVVAGVALLAAFGPRSPAGAWLEETLGLRLAFSTHGVVLAQLFVALPFVVVTLEAALRLLGGRYEEAAATLGAGRWDAFRTVTLPLMGPSLAAGASLAWARALGEFGATITFAGERLGGTETLPASIYMALEADAGAAAVLSALLVAVAVVVLVALRGRWLGRPAAAS